jgi:TP901-1 family phage major tail protein
MATFAGEDLVLKVATSAGSTSYTTVGLMTNHSLNISNEQSDITSKDDDRWGSMASYGKREVTLTGEGIVSDDSAFAQLETVAQTAGTNLVYQIAYGNNKTITGSFNLSGLEYSAPNNDAQRFSLTLNSNGTPTFA